jgi:hypothetical protein
MSDREAKALAFWRAHPVDAIKDWFKVTPTDYQGDILQDMFAQEGAKETRVAIKSAHGVGKTTLTSWAGWYWLITRTPSRVVATAPVQAQLRDVLWPEYAKWWSRMPDGLKEQWNISGEHIRNKESPKDWFAVSRTSNRPENLQGFHHQNLMIQADEASGVAGNVFEVIEGALSEADLPGSEAMLMMTGNPNFTAGEFYNAFYKNADIYKRYTITGDPTTMPTKNCGKFYFSERVTEKYRRNMGKKYGTTGSVYDVRVRGMFPRMDDGAVIPLEWAERAVRVPLPSFDRVADPFTLVMDVARMGADETVLGLFRRNHCISMKAWPKTSTEQCVDILKEKYDLLHDQGYRVDRIIVDEPGVGGGVIDTGLRRNLPITPYNGGQTMKADKDPEEDQRMYANRRTRDWWNVRRYMEREDCHIPDDETLVNQLASVQYDYNEREKILVESKRKMRDRLGDDASPDRADVIVMGLAPWYSMQKSVFAVDMRDVFYGADRPQPETDLW